MQIYPCVSCDDETVDCPLNLKLPSPYSISSVLFMCPSTKLCEVPWAGSGCGSKLVVLKGKNTVLQACMCVVELVET
jgi:hypothetical protein